MYPGGVLRVSSGLMNYFIAWDRWGRVNQNVYIWWNNGRRGNVFHMNTSASIRSLNRKKNLRYDSSYGFWCAKGYCRYKRNVHPKTVKGKYYKRLGCRIHLRGQQRQRWHEIVNKCRSKNKLSIYADNKSYDFSSLLAMRANGYYPKDFKRLLHNYKSRFGQDGCYF